MIEQEYQPYRQLIAGMKLLEMLSDAESDVRNGRVAPMQSSFDALRDELRKRKWE